MHKETLWRYLLSRNPKMESGGAMTPAGYRKFFDLVWEQAQKEYSERATCEMPEFMNVFRRGEK